MRDFVIGAQVDDPPHTEVSEGCGARFFEPGQISRAEQHTEARAPGSRRQAADVPQVDRARNERIGDHASGARRGGTGYRPAIAIRLKALIETRIQLRATYSCSVSTPPTWSYTSSATP